tara:strand:+ start:9637 stop:9894 length:258 start_codon:yes stop_codon:yes gene_type:complete
MLIDRQIESNLTNSFTTNSRLEEITECDFGCWMPRKKYSRTTNDRDDAIPPDLDWIIEAWSTLSDSLRTEILKLVRDGVSISTTS